jgi:soluble lytic murein transglycosylase-like protein
MILLIVSIQAVSFTEITNHSKSLARYYDIPHEIVLAVIRAESDFNQQAVSDKGAYGLMQITKQCYTHYTNTYSSTMYTNFDMVKTNWKFNILLGCWYLKKVCYAKHRSWKLAIMAFFSGPWHPKMQSFNYYATVVRKSNLKLPIPD